MKIGNKVAGDTKATSSRPDHERVQEPGRRRLLAAAAVLGLFELSACRSYPQESPMSQSIPPQKQPQRDSHSGSLTGARQVPAEVVSKRTRVLHVVTNVGHYEDASHPTGLWLSELTHAYDIFAANGYEQHVVSPRGGNTPIEPRSLKWPHFDNSAREGRKNATLLKLLAETARPDEIDASAFDAIYFTGGHGVMWDFPDDTGLQAITRSIYENGGVVSSVCHGYCGLLNTRLSNGRLLIEGRHITGYSWVEEVLAGVAKKVPYNAEQAARARGALYEKNVIPFTSNVVVDGRLVTGQNPQSAHATAREVVRLLSGSAARLA